ncbi:interactor of HORMAD1 protein 1 [Parambassis ranga]|uniref:Interactor of HORMAD1 protein 1 n=1 Tax=Parambassis ranga TaxID=210632 RepID=A0A6P7I8H9_9TELE|nr:interactor of HORMAD1 protein 1 [Parambassis ranga]
MNHMRNIKEMLSIPTGSRNAATSGYSSLTDSQFLFGSQFWPENSQGTSQDVSISSRNSQQSSQEGSDPKFLISYHTKPLLFGDLKDKNRNSGLLDRFAEDRTKVKDKNEGDILAKECQQIRETLNSIQQLVLGTEKNTAVCETVLEKFDSFASTLQKNLNSLQSDISQQFESLANKVNSQKEVLTELEEKVQKNEDTAAKLDLHLQGLKDSLECIREEHIRERDMLEEALKLLNTLISEQSAKGSTDRVMDSAIQTSPGLQQSMSILQDNKLEGTQLTCVSDNLEQSQVEVPPKKSSNNTMNRGFTVKCIRRRKKRSPAPSQRSKCTDENRRPLMNCNKQPKVSTSLREHRDLRATSRDTRNPGSVMPLNWETKLSETAGCYITPANGWSQDSSSSICLHGIEPILEKLSSSESKIDPIKPIGMLELCEINYDSD